MAFSAAFVANFDSWNKAVDDAKKNMKVFGRDVELSTKGVQAQLQRMTTSFDGSKILKDANLAVTAIDKIGGAAKLTETEQKRVNATVTEALAKYKALGQEAPAALQKLARETENAGKAAHGLSGFAQTALGSFAGFLSAQAVIGGVTAAVRGVGAVMSSAFQTNATLEKTTLQFTTLMGNADQAKAHVKGLFDFAKATPFETGPIIEASRTLQVFGRDALNSKQNLTLVGDAAAATGAPIQEVANWVGRMHAAFAQNKPIGEALQNLTRLGIVGPEASLALQKVASGGGTVEEKFKTMQVVLGQFTGAMQAQANTWDGITSSLADVIDLTLADAFNGLYETARDAMGNVVKILGNEGVTGALGKVGEAITGAFGVDKRSAVDGMTLAFVRVADVALTSAEMIVRGWQFVSGLVLGVMATMAQAEAIKQRVMTASPFAPEASKQAARDAQAFADSLSRDAEAAGRAADGHSKFVQSLQGLRTELAKAAADAAKMAQATTATGTAAAGAKAAGSTLTGGVVELTDAQKTAAEAAKKHATELAKVSGADKVQAALKLTQLITELGGTGQIAASQFADLNKILTEGIIVGVELKKKLPSAMVQFARETQAANVQLGGMVEFLKLIKQFEIAGDPNKLIPAPMPQFPGVTSGIPASLIGYANQVSTPGINGALVPTGKGAGIDWKSILGGVPQQLMNVFSQGGEPLTTAEQRGSGIGSIAGGVGGAALGSAVSASSGLLKAVGGALPIIGPIVGGMLGKWVGGLFGPSKNAIADTEATGRISTSQQKLIDQFGSLDKIAGMNTAGAELAAGWGHQGRAGEAAFNAQTEAFLAMVEKQNGLLSEQDTLQAKLLSTEQRRSELAASLVATWDQVSAAISKYGTSAEALGPQIAQMGTTAGFTDLLEDIDLFTRAGATAGGVLNSMKEEISKAVTEAMKLGTDVPENMKPWIEELSRTGRLLDANGEAITDLTGIKWGAAAVTEAEKTRAEIGKLDETFATVTAALDLIVKQLSELLPTAAADGARGVQGAFDANRPTLGVDVEYNDPGYSPDGRETGPGFASGSGGIRNFGRGTLAMLHGREAVVTEAEYDALQAAARGKARGQGMGTVAPRAASTADVSQTVVVMLDRRVLASATARGLPGYLELLGA